MSWRDAMDNDEMRAIERDAREMFDLGDTQEIDITDVIAASEQATDEAIRNAGKRVWIDDELIDLGGEG